MTLPLRSMRYIEGNSMNMLGPLTDTWKNQDSKRRLSKNHWGQSRMKIRNPQEIWVKNEVAVDEID